MSDGIKIIKRKATGFFKSDDLLKIKKAISQVNAIISNASIILRAYYLSRFKESKESIIIDEQLIGFACSVVQGKTKPQLRGSNTSSSPLLETFQQLVTINKDIFGNAFVASDLSLSHILNYSIGNLITAYKNNIAGHFTKYPKRVIRCHLINKGFKNKEAIKIAAIITNHHFYNSPITTEDGMVEGVDPGKFVKLFPPKRKDEKPLVYDIEVKPWLYLQFMVALNRMLETQYPDVPHKYRKLLNPLPFHSSFVPMHVRIDTSGLSQLLMTQKRIEEFKKWYLAIRGEDLKMTTKGNMLLSFEKLHGRQAKDKAEEGAYATDLWDYLTNLKTCKQWVQVLQNPMDSGTMVFDNAVMTEGVSISFQVIEKSKFGRKEFGKKKKAQHENTEEKEDPPVSATAKKISLDPGKKDILFLTDGVTTLRYTKGQRQQDTMLHARRNETLKRRRKAGLEDFETKVMSETSKKSCYYDTFLKYCRARASKEAELRVVYGHPVFRQFKFLGYCQTKSSEDRFAHKVQATFSKSSEPLKSKKTFKSLDPEMLKNAKKVTNELVIGWGNWGKNPNALKGSAPTPGIGIRRRFERFFQTRTVCEHMTSQTCPCCKESRTLKKYGIGGKERHHLLRCTNEKCESRWWNRNVAGSLNILYRFMRMNALPEIEASRGRMKRVPPLTSRT